MNIELTKSLLYKVLPTITAIAVSRGWIDEAIGAKLPAVIDWVFVGISLLPTFIRSVKSHKKVELKDASAS